MLQQVLFMFILQMLVFDFSVMIEEQQIEYVMRLLLQNMEVEIEVDGSSNKDIVEKQDEKEE